METQAIYNNKEIRGDYMRTKLLFAERLKALMVQRNISQVELAEALGVSQATISFWIRGVKEPRLKKMDKLCEALQCTRNDLLGESTSVDYLVTLNNDEYALIEAYNKADDHTKQLVKLALSKYAELLNLNKKEGE